MIEDWIVLNMRPAQIATALEEMADELIDSIDGGEECRGRDSRISHQADLLRRAAMFVQKSESPSNYEERLARLTALDKERTRLLAMTFDQPHALPASQQPGNF